MLLDRPPKDFDIATSATPHVIENLFERTKAVGKAFGVMCVIIDRHPFEVATFRRDLDYHDGRHPAGVEFSSAREDALRRDFTVNGLFWDPGQHEVIDYVGGRSDLEQRMIRAIGDPYVRFREDYLRMLRAVRFSATLEFTLEQKTAQAIRDLAPRIREISIERIQQEFTRILLEAPRAGQALRALLELGLLQQFIPELAALADQEQPSEFHPEGDVFTHTTLMLDAMEQPDLDLAYAVLLHDIGKPATAAVGPDRRGGQRLRFDRHAHVGAEIAEEIMRRLKLPRNHIEYVTHCIGNHMRFMHVQDMRRAKLRQLVGTPTFATELELHRLDCLASHGKLDNYSFLQQWMQELQAKQQSALPPPWINGHDLMAMGLPEGPTIGRLLQKAYEAQIEERFSSRDELLSWLRTQL
jgi:poly(A) polymerase